MVISAVLKLKPCYVIARGHVMTMCPRALVVKADA
jgi:hypothetical protein